MKKYSSRFHEWEFNTYYIKDFFEAGQVLNTLDKVKLIGIDIETSKKEDFKDHPMAGLCPLLSNIRLIQFYDGKSNVYIFDLFKLSVLPVALKDFLKTHRFVAHNATFEIKSFTHAGLPDLNIGCSMLLSQLIDGAEHSPFEPLLLPGEEAEEEEADGMSKYRRRFHNLDAAVQRNFGIKVEKTQQVSDWGAETLSKEQILYASLDAVLTYKLAVKLSPKLQEYKMERIYRLQKDMQHVVATMELSGIGVDWSYHADLMEKWNRESDIAMEKCKPHFGQTNMRSGKQMNEWLKEYLKDDPVTLASWPKTEKGSFGFSRTAIFSYSHLPPVAALLHYKKYAKLIDTYGESLAEKKHPVTGRLHPSYTLGETRTGRLSSRTPNAQNFPHDKEFRSMFAVEKPRALVVGDLSQIELRLQAEFSKDPIMLQVFKEGGDIYKRMSSHYLGIPEDRVTDDQRNFGKVIMLSLGFGMGPTKLGLYAQNGWGLKRPQHEWDKAHKAYHTLFETYSKWCDRMRTRAEKLGYAETIIGARRRLMPDEIYTRAPNSCIQGSAAAVIMQAMLDCKDRLGSLGNLIFTIHDEAGVECDEKDASAVKEILTQSMQGAMRKFFPKAVSFDVAKVKVGQTWAEVK